MAAVYLARDQRHDRKVALKVLKPELGAGGMSTVYLARDVKHNRRSQGISDRPEWTPDGTRVLFSLAHKDEHYALWWKAADASAPAESLYAGINVIREGVITPDGRAVVYREDAPRTNRDIYLLPLAGDRKPVPLLTSAFDDLMPRISPDGKWLAYLSDEFGQYDVFVRPLSAPGAAANGWKALMLMRGARAIRFEAMAVHSGRSRVDVDAVPKPWLARIYK